MGSTNLYLSDRASLNPVGDLTGNLSVYVTSSGAYVDESFYPYVFIAGLMIDYTAAGIGTSLIPASNIVWTGPGTGAMYLLSASKLYYSNGTSWSQINQNSISGVAGTGTATYSASGFTSTAHLLDSSGNEFQVPYGLCSSVNVRILITSTQSNNGPFISVDELVIVGPNASGEFKTVTVHNMFVSTYGSWSVAYAMNSSTSAGTMHITASASPSGEGPFNALATVTWVTNANSSNTSGP
jgi:hypothetical protein